MNLVLLSVIAVLALMPFLAVKNLLLLGTVRKLLASGARVIDVRSELEYRSGHYSAAVNIPLEQIERRLREIGEDRSAPVILYCYGGSRSSIARGILKKNGFGRVVNARSFSFMKRFDTKR